MSTVTERSFKYLDERLGTASLARTALRKVFPDHWSFLLKVDRLHQPRC